MADLCVDCLDSIKTDWTILNPIQPIFMPREHLGTASIGATGGLSQSPLSRASRSFTGPTLKGGSGSISARLLRVDSRMSGAGAAQVAADITGRLELPEAEVCRDRVIKFRQAETAT